MIKIDFNKLFNDLGIFDALKKGLKENTKMSEDEINKFISSSVNKHGSKMNGVLEGFDNYFMSKKEEKFTDEEMKNVDKELDEMISKIQNNYKQAEKEK